MNIFDALQKSTFATVATTMGYDAVWLSSSAPGFDPATFTPEDFNTYSSFTTQARVLFKGPTEKKKLMDADFDPDKLTLEYQQGDFDGLNELAADSSFEIIYIIGIGYFNIKSISKKWDGKTFEATLAIIS